MQAAIFDWGGVLMRTVDLEPRQRWAVRLGLSAGEVYQAVLGAPTWDKLQTGRLTLDEFLIWLGEQLGLDAGELRDFWRDFWSGDRLDDELVAYIRELKADGYQVALLSNAPPGLVKRIEEGYGVTDAFDVLVCSGDVGMKKPDPAIYRLTLERLGVEPEQALFVDDFVSNLEGAAALGIHTCHFRAGADWRSELDEKLGRQRTLRKRYLVSIQAVIFDFGGVLMELVGPGQVEVWARRLALDPTVLSQALWGDDWRALARGAIGDEEYHRRVGQMLGLPDLATTREFIRAFYAGETLVPEMLELIERLRGRVKLGLLTNAFPGQADVLRDKFDWDPQVVFDAYVNSAEVGLVKPDPRIYQLTLDRLSDSQESPIAPEEAIFIDDSAVNVQAAAGLGFQAILFTTPAEIVAQVEGLVNPPNGPQPA